MSDLQSLLAELQAGYLAGLDAKRVHFEDLWRRGERKLLQTEYHKLKGTGRTYGVPELSVLGEALEKICESVADQALLDSAVPLSLSLLESVRRERASGRPFAIEETAEFTTLKQILHDHSQSKT